MNGEVISRPAPSLPSDPPVDTSASTLQDFSDRLYEVAQLVCGSNYIRLMELHADMLATIRDRQQPRPRPVRRRR